MLNILEIVEFVNVHRGKRVFSLFLLMAKMLEKYNCFKKLVAFGLMCA